jgi:hypothetical protein
MPEGVLDAGRAGRPPTAGELITASDVHTRMPKTLEVVCTRDECDLDMFELHYRYSMPDGTGVESFVCPYCRENDGLESIQA